MADVLWAAATPMKVAFVVNNYPPRTGGVELHVCALAHELRRLGHSPLVVTLGPDTGSTVRDGIPVMTLPEHLRVADILGFPGWGTRRRLTKLLREQNVSAVSVHTRFFPMSYVGYRAARRAAIPVIHTEHGSGHVESDSPVIKWASRLVDWTVGRIVLRGADVVLGVSEEVCSFVNRLSGVDAELFYNAIHLDDLQDAPSVPLPDKLVFVGRLVAGKGWNVFLEMLHREKVSGRSVDGHVVGDGPDMSEVVARIKSLGLEEDVVVHGRVSQREVRELLRGATLVNPTVLAEGFQTTLLEAIAEGGRVLTYPVPGARRLQDQGAPVCIAEEPNPEALLSALWRMDSQRPPAAPRELVEEWGWERRGQQFESVMTNIAGSA